jgi:arsenate reductase-like glutaredoxin family protein
MANELKTYGDLKAAIESISLKQKGEKIAGVGLGVLMGFIPGAEAAKTTYDFIKAAISKPDSKKTNTWLDKLDIDDNMSKIIDDTVENGFLQTMVKTIEGESDSKPLEQDFNMNQKLVDYLKSNYQGRTIIGIKENKMNKLQLRQLIREEISKFTEATTTPATTTPAAATPATQQPKQSPEVKKLIDYLNTTGKAALGSINNRTELNQILTAIWNGMNKTMQKDSSAVSVYNIISQKIK